MASYLKFVEVPSKGKTKVFSILNTSNQFLGQVKWSGPWRKYTFHPFNAVFDNKCLMEVIKFIDDLMEDRKNGING